MPAGLIGSFSLLVPFFVGVILITKLNNIQKIFFGYICFSILIESLVVCTGLNNIDNRWLFKLFLCFELIYFNWLFNKNIQQPKWLNNLSWLCFFGAVYYLCTNYIYSEKSYNDFYYYSIIFLFNIIQSAFTIIKIFMNTNNPMESFLIWISGARLLYYLLILFIFVYSNLEATSLSNDTFVIVFTTVNISANVLCNLIYAKVFMVQNETSIIVLVIIFTVCVFAMGLFFFLLINIFHKQLKNRQKEALDNLVLGQMNERERLARDLHDELVPDLSNILFTLDHFLTDNPFQIKLIEKSTKELNDSITNLRHISHNLMSVSLKKHGLAEAIQDMVDEHKNGIKVSFHSNSFGVKFSDTIKSIFLIFLKNYITIQRNTVKQKKYSLN